MIQLFAWSIFSPVPHAVDNQEWIVSGNRRDRAVRFCNGKLNVLARILLIGIIFPVNNHPPENLRQFFRFLFAYRQPDIRRGQPNGRLLNFF